MSAKGARRGSVYTERYLYARAVNQKHLALQVQRILKTLHPEPLFNVVQSSGKKPSRIKNAYSLDRDTGDIVLYDGTQAPVDRGGESGLFTVNHYDSPSSECAVAQFSRAGVYFVPAATPCLLPESSIRLTRAGGARTSISSRDDVLGAFYDQPVAWFLVPETSGADEAFRVVDHSTDSVIGRWVRKDGKSGTKRWYFLRKGEKLAVLEDSQLRAADCSISYLDEFTRSLRRVQVAVGEDEGVRKRRNSIQSVVSSNGVMSIGPLSKVRSIRRSHSTNSQFSQNHQNRIRFIEAIMICSLALMQRVTENRPPVVVESTRVAKPVASAAAESNASDNSSKAIKSPAEIDVVDNSNGVKSPGSPNTTTTKKKRRRTIMLSNPLVGFFANMLPRKKNVTL
ncbi:hypothetical protein TRVA0_027S01706 [Trichomonascus vanleenenianus]|uniref:uncharacterized protein n=1 Tax=Trichomonascus vanleenenianus TaxID=2268995 RepID=UPI003ECABE0D